MCIFCHGDATDLLESYSQIFGLHDICFGANFDNYSLIIFARYVKFMSHVILGTFRFAATQFHKFAEKVILRFSYCLLHDMLFWSFFKTMFVRQIRCAELIINASFLLHWRINDLFKLLSDSFQLLCRVDYSLILIGNSRFLTCLWNGGEIFCSVSRILPAHNECAINCQASYIW